MEKDYSTIIMSAIVCNRLRIFMFNIESQNQNLIQFSFMTYYSEIHESSVNYSAVIKTKMIYYAWGEIEFDLNCLKLLLNIYTMKWKKEKKNHPCSKHWCISRSQRVE